MSHQITTSQEAITFLTGGNATITLVSKVSGNHMTFKITKPWDRKTNKRDFGSNMFFVNQLTGDPNADDYKNYIGFFKSGNLIAGKKGKPDSKGFKAFDWAWSKLNSGEIPKQLEILHSGNCCRCGRQITHPDSLARGIGPECIKHF